VVTEAPIPKTSGARPPNFGVPPIGTTFCPDPDDRDDMLVTLKDNVKRLISQARLSDRANAPTFMRLLDQRRDWLRGELDVEGMMTEPPKAPLGIPENFYDLSTLTTEPIDDRRRDYEGMIDQIDRTMSELWEQMLGGEESAE
jgi:hypothetical protein